MEYHERKNIRLPGYDYSRMGGYFVTVCTAQRRCILSRVRPGNRFALADVCLTELGTVVKNAIAEAELRTGIRVLANVIMPNHIHLILQIPEGKTSHTVGDFVGMFKSLTLYHWRKRCNRLGIRMGTVWQRNYYEHIIRNELDLREKLRYMEENPEVWNLDKLHQR